MSIVIFKQNSIEIKLDKSDNIISCYKNNVLERIIYLSHFTFNDYSRIDNIFIYLINDRFISITLRQDINYKIVIYDTLLLRQHLGLIFNKKYDTIGELYKIYGYIKKLLNIKHNSSI